MRKDRIDEVAKAVAKETEIDEEIMLTSKNEGNWETSGATFLSTALGDGTVKSFYENQQKTFLDAGAIEEVQKIRKNHPSVIAIIEIPNTEILYPIVQGEDNLFYLDHDKDGNYHPFGEVYLDCRNDSKFTDNNSVIYGHNIRSAKTIFNNLLNYSEKEFFENHKIINIYSLEGFKQYEIISVFKAKPQEPYRETEFDSQGGFEEFVENYHDMSLVDSTFDIEDLESILTLSTCFDNSYRFVILGVRVNE